jgi:hypothetical protein
MNVFSLRLKAAWLMVAIVALSLFPGCNGESNPIGTTSEPATAVNQSEQWIEKSTEKGPVKLVVRVTPKEPRLSDLVEMELMVIGQDNITIERPPFGQAVGDFLVRDFSEKDRDLSGVMVPRNGRLFRYQLEPVHAGIHLIRSIAVDFIDNREGSEAFGERSQIVSEPIELTITSELGDAIPDLANLEPMVAPKAIDGTTGWIWILPSAFLVLTFVLLLWLTRGRKIDPAMLPLQSPQEIAKAQMEQLLAEQLPAKGLFKDFYLRLTGIVRQYIEGSTGLKAPEQTTAEFLVEARGKSCFSSQQAGMLQDFLEAADMVKYAAQLPDNEQIDDAISRAKLFIESQLSPPEVAKAKEPVDPVPADEVHGKTPDARASSVDSHLADDSRYMGGGL